MCINYIINIPITMNSELNLSKKHLLFALLIVVIWGLNFIAIYYGLQVFSPYLFCTIRFALCAFPFVFFLPKPQAPWHYLVAYGVINFAIQFGLLFSSINVGLSPGLASLLMQTQIFFSIILSYFLFGEIPSLIKIIGSLISFIGLGIVAFNINGNSTGLGLILVLLAALSWGLGNIATKKVNAKSPLALVVWGNLFALPFMAIASLFFDGPTAIVESFSKVSFLIILALAYVVYLSTHVAYGVWGFLVQTYPAATIAPYTLLIPVVGFISSAVFLNEGITSWKIIASCFIMAGLVFNLLEKQILKLFSR